MRWNYLVAGLVLLVLIVAPASALEVTDTYDDDSYPTDLGVDSFSGLEPHLNTTGLGATLVLNDTVYDYDPVYEGNDWGWGVYNGNASRWTPHRLHHEFDNEQPEYGFRNSGPGSADMHVSGNVSKINGSISIKKGEVYPSNSYSPRQVNATVSTFYPTGQPGIGIRNRGTGNMYVFYVTPDYGGEVGIWNISSSSWVWFDGSVTVDTFTDYNISVVQDYDTSPTFRSTFRFYVNGSQVGPDPMYGPGNVTVPSPSGDSARALHYGIGEGTTSNEGDLNAGIIDFLDVSANYENDTVRDGFINSSWRPTEYDGQVYDGDYPGVVHTGFEQTYLKDEFGRNNAGFNETGLTIGSLELIQSYNTEGVSFWANFTAVENGDPHNYENRVEVGEDRLVWTGGTDPYSYDLQTRFGLPDDDEEVSVGEVPQYIAPELEYRDEVVLGVKWQKEINNQFTPVERQILRFQNNHTGNSVFSDVDTEYIDYVTVSNLNSSTWTTGGHEKEFASALYQVRYRTGETYGKVAELASDMQFWTFLMVVGMSGLVAYLMTTGMGMVFFLAATMVLASGGWIPLYVFPVEVIGVGAYMWFVYVNERE